MSAYHPQLIQNSALPWFIQVLASGRSFPPEVLDAAGAISIATRSTVLDIDDAADVDFTIADGEEGQEHVIVLRTMADTGGAVVTAVNADTYTFDAADEFASLIFLGGQWRMIAGTATAA